MHPSGESVLKSVWQYHVFCSQIGNVVPFLVRLHIVGIVGRGPSLFDKDVFAGEHVQRVIKRAVQLICMAACRQSQDRSSEGVC